MAACLCIITESNHMIFFLYILFILPMYLFSADKPSINEKQVLPLFQQDEKNRQASIKWLLENGIMVPELCYGVSEDPKKNPLLILGTSPCIAAFIKGTDTPKTIGFHISAHNEIESMTKIINEALNFKPNEKMPKIYVTLFTLTKDLYNDGYNSRFIFKKGSHEMRLNAIIEKLNEKYTLMNPQYHIPYLVDKHGKNEQDVQHNDRHVICNGFDKEHERLQVYRLDLKIYPIVGLDFVKTLLSFSHKVIQKLCHENKCEVNLVEEEQSQPEYEAASLRLGDKWDYPFFKINGPNIEEIVKYRQGENLIDDISNTTSTIATPARTSTIANATGNETKPAAIPKNPNAPQEKNPSFITRWYNAAKQKLNNSLTWFNVATAVGLAGLAGWLYTRWGNNSRLSTPYEERSALTRKLLPHKP